LYYIRHWRGFPDHSNWRTSSSPIAVDKSPNHDILYTVKGVVKTHRKDNAAMKTPIWVVTEVHARIDYTLLITFISGEQRVYDARPLLEKRIYSSLKNLTFFLSARADYGTVVWNDDVDIAPEHLYECSCPVSLDTVH
jgi:hypothetical protein